MEVQLTFDDQDIMQKVCGPDDTNITYIEFLTSCFIVEKGNALFLSSDSESVLQHTKHLISGLQKLAVEEDELSINDVFLEWKHQNSSQEHTLDWSDESQKSCIVVRGRKYFPKTASQETFINLMETQQIVIASGPAGTGKTFLAVAYALSMLVQGKCQKLVLTRPVVEAGESLGFLPGDLTQKINPYLRPLYDAMEAILGPIAVRKLEANGSIEVAPMAYMRGRSLQNAVVLLDEAQNTTKEQMLMFLTRIGENAKAVITGDESQIDLPRNKTSGLTHAISVLKGIEGLGIVRFQNNDVVRARIVQKIIQAYTSQSQVRGEGL